ncbi:MAG: transporter [Bacteroides sp.]|nr:transporter [Bacteroides sp.]
MTKKYLLLLILIGFGLESSAQIITDRPDQTESSSTVPKKSFQLEAGVLFGDLNNDAQRLYLLPTTLFRYGLTRGIELRLGENLVNYKSESTSEARFGLSDLELGAKFQILKREDINTEIAFLSHVILPTGSEGLSIDGYGTINKLSLSHELNSFLGLGYNVGYDYFGNSWGAFTYSIALGAGFNEKLGAYLEFYGRSSDLTGFLVNFDSGITYLLQENLQLDFSFALGLNHRMNYFAVGVSWNIGGEK